MAQTHETKVIWEDGASAFVWLGAGDPAVERGISSHQYLVFDRDWATVLDPGGFHVAERVLENVGRYVTIANVSQLNLFLSHQDPDVCASLVAWIEARPDAVVVVSALWERFLEHFAVPEVPRTHLLPDEGGTLPMPSGGSLTFVPAHYLHSPGNFTDYVDEARILFSGDIGAAVVPPERWSLYVDDFDEHVQFMEGFHKRYMGSNLALRQWVERVRALEIDVICPQHGSIMQGDDVTRFLDWLESLDVGVDAR
jgi:flavorubredoxin